MNDLDSFEKDIKQTYRLPEADPAFFNRLEAKLQAYQLNPEEKAKPTFHFARGWAFAMVILLILGSAVLAIGPSKVLAQIQAAFGFVPNVGLVNTSSPFRQLAAPVSDTRDGITLAIQSAFLSADQTTITYTMSDLPAEIKRARFGDPECLTPAHLTLPDGSKIKHPKAAAASRRTGHSSTLSTSMARSRRTSTRLPWSFLAWKVRPGARDRKTGRSLLPSSPPPRIPLFTRPPSCRPRS